MTSLASTLYAAFRSAQSDPTALPAWGNLPSDERAAWERVAASALELCQPAIVGYRCACGRDHMFETREQVAIERDEAIRQRDEAQRAVRDGFPATVAVIRQQRDEAIADVVKLQEEGNKLLDERDAAHQALAREVIKGDDLQAEVDQLARQRGVALALADRAIEVAQDADRRSDWKQEIAEMVEQRKAIVP
jgi:hypothetical protein